MLAPGLAGRARRGPSSSSNPDVNLSLPSNPQATLNPHLGRLSPNPDACGRHCLLDESRCLVNELRSLPSSTQPFVDGTDELEC